MDQVLDLLGFFVHELSGNEVRGLCPLHSSKSSRSRSFSANVVKNVYRCFRFGSAGNQLNLYAAVTRQSLLQPHSTCVLVCNANSRGLTPSDPSAFIVMPIRLGGQL